MSCIALRTSRFFPEPDDDKATREAFDDGNVKANEFLFRRVDLHDVVSAHLIAAERAPALGLGRYIISATTPFLPEDVAELRRDAASVLGQRVTDYDQVYRRHGWRMFTTIDRVYDNRAARTDLGWTPRYDFAHQLDCLREDKDPRSPIAIAVGSKGYHATTFDGMPYPVA